MACEMPPLIQPHNNICCYHHHPTSYSHPTLSPRNLRPRPVMVTAFPPKLTIEARLLYPPLVERVSRATGIHISITNPSQLSDAAE